MGWTKRQLVEAAFEEIGLAAYVYDLTSEQMDSALRRMDSMMAVWNGKGIRIGYSLPSSADSSDLDDESGLIDAAYETVITSLAIKIAPSIGKIVSPDTKITARDGFRVLLSKAAKPNERQLDNAVPRGQGNKPWGNDEFLNRPTDLLTVGDDDTLDFE